MPIAPVLLLLLNEAADAFAVNAEVITAHAAIAATHRLKECFPIKNALSFCDLGHCFFYDIQDTKRCTAVQAERHVIFCAFLRNSDGVNPVCSLNCLAK